MNNLMKILLASAVFATGAFASVGTNVVLDLKEDATNQGTINAYGDMTLDFGNDKWIENRGKIVLKDSGNKKVFIRQTISSGSDAETSGKVTSGIRNHGHQFVEIKVADESAIPNVAGENLAVKPDSGGKYWAPVGSANAGVYASDGTTPAVDGTDYQGYNGGGIQEVLDESLYEYLTTMHESGSTETPAAGTTDLLVNETLNKHATVLRDTGSCTVSSVKLVLKAPTTGAGSNSSSVLTINTPFVNHSNYETFVKPQGESVTLPITIGDDTPSATLSGNHSFEASGYFDFAANNSGFTEGSFTVSGGVSTITAKNAMFPVATTTVSAGELALNVTEESDKSITLESGRTLSVNPDGKLSIASGTGFTVASGGILNLGVPVA